MVKALKYVLLFILYYRYLSFRAQYQYSELLQLAFEACYAPRAFFYCFLELHLYRLLAKIAIKSESKVLIDRKCQDKTSLINVNSPNSRYDYSKCSAPKNSGQWKFGFSSSIGFQERKWGV